MLFKNLIQGMYIFSQSFLLTIVFYRFREVPTFGCDVIRRFHVNVSSQKRIAARDYEDILQVCIYIFLSNYTDIGLVYCTGHRRDFSQKGRQDHSRPYLYDARMALYCKATSTNQGNHATLRWTRSQTWKSLEKIQEDGLCKIHHKGTPSRSSGKRT